jgi:acylphosphatase
MSAQRLMLRIQGRVQGVGYRYATVRHAQRLGVTGWVRNSADGAVELIAEGSEQQLHALLEWCRHGPPSAHVDGIDAQWTEATGEFDSFETRR